MTGGSFHGVKAEIHGQFKLTVLTAAEKTDRVCRKKLMKITPSVKTGDFSKDGRVHLFQFKLKFVFVRIFDTRSILLFSFVNIDDAATAKQNK